MGGVGQPEGRGEVGEGEGRKREGITMASDWRGGHPHYSFCAPWPLGLASACPSAPVASPAPPPQQAPRRVDGSGGLLPGTPGPGKDGRRGAKEGHLETALTF